MQEQQQGYLQQLLSQHHLQTKRQIQYCIKKITDDVIYNQLVCSNSQIITVKRGQSDPNRVRTRNSIQNKNQPSTQSKQQQQQDKIQQFMYKQTQLKNQMEQQQQQQQQLQQKIKQMQLARRQRQQQHIRTQHQIKKVCENIAVEQKIQKQMQNIRKKIIQQQRYILQQKRNQYYSQQQGKHQIKMQHRHPNATNKSTYLHKQFQYDLKHLCTSKYKQIKEEQKNYHSNKKQQNTEIIQKNKHHKPASNSQQLQHHQQKIVDEIRNGESMNPKEKKYWHMQQYKLRSHHTKNNQERQDATTNHEKTNKYMDYLSQVRLRNKVNISAQQSVKRITSKRSMSVHDKTQALLKYAEWMDRKARRVERYDQGDGICELDCLYKSAIQARLFVFCEM